VEREVGRFSKVDQARCSEVFTECPTLREILDKSETKNLKID
jgi:hypothetical protein